jgi:hypothetical protein
MRALVLCIAASKIHATFITKAVCKRCWIGGRGSFMICVEIFNQLQVAGLLFKMLFCTIN